MWSRPSESGRVRAVTMRSEKDGPPVSLRKKAIFAVLLLTSCAIALSGAAYGVYSILFNISFPVLNTQVSGAVFGVCVLYLGIRYLMMVLNLKKELYQPTSRFSWSHFHGKKSG